MIVEGVLIDWGVIVVQCHEYKIRNNEDIKEVAFILDRDVGKYVEQAIEAYLDEKADSKK